MSNKEPSDCIASTIRTCVRNLIFHLSSSYLAISLPIYIAIHVNHLIVLINSIRPTTCSLIFFSAALVTRSTSRIRVTIDKFPIGDKQRATKRQATIPVAKFSLHMIVYSIVYMITRVTWLTTKIWRKHLYLISRPKNDNQFLHKVNTK